MEKTSNSTVVALFVRMPVPGRAKTRLATDLEDEGACSLYRSMVADILFNTVGCGFEVYRETKDLRVVQEVLRHSSPATAAKYSDVDSKKNRHTKHISIKISR